MYRFLSRPVFVIACSALLGAVATGPGAAVSSGDDASDFNGTACRPEQYFDATVQRCLPELVTNDPQGEPQASDIGANYDGTKCAGGQFYNGSEASCALEAVTNDPQMTQILENGEPIDSNLPVGGAA